MTVASTEPLKAADLISVRSRVSWGAIAAGAMVALTIYVVLMLLGVTIGIEVAVRGTRVNMGAGSGLYTIVILAIAMFFGGWATSRLAVGEDKTEALLHAIILWGVLFLGLVWLVSSGIRTGFSAMMGVASGSYATAEAAAPMDVDRVAADLKRAGVDDAQVDKAVSYYQQMKESPVAAIQHATEDPEAKEAATALVEMSRQATRWTLTGVIVSLLLVIIGALVGSGEVPIPVPLGVMRRRVV